MYVRGSEFFILFAVKCNSNSVFFSTFLRYLIKLTYRLHKKVSIQYCILGLKETVLHDYDVSALLIQTIENSI